MTMTMDENISKSTQKPGAQLGAIRMERGLTQEYVAGKLNLRVDLIEQLENDAYDLLPQAVFVKGYLRAYAQLLGIPSDPLVTIFNQLDKSESKTEKLWQNRRETNKVEHAIRWITAFFGLIVLLAVIMWWYSNKENLAFFKTTINHQEAAANKLENDIRLTDLSKMRSLLSSQSQTEIFTPAEAKSE